MLFATTTTTRYQRPRRLAFWIQILLIFSCIVAIAHGAVKKSKTKKPVVKKVVAEDAEEAPADEEAKPEGEEDPTLNPKVWSDVYSIPTEGYEIVGKLKPNPCPPLSVPTVLVPAVDMAGCMTINALKKLCPSHGDSANVIGMSYTRAAGTNNSDEASNNWLILSTKYHNGYMWVGFYKFCSIEYVGEPYLGVTLSAGMYQPGEFNPAQWAGYGILYAKTC